MGIAGHRTRAEIPHLVDLPGCSSTSTNSPQSFPNLELKLDLPLPFVFSAPGIVAIQRVEFGAVPFWVVWAHLTGGGIVVSNNGNGLMV